MRIKVMIQRQKQALGVPSQQKAQHRHRQQPQPDRAEKPGVISRLQPQAGDCAQPRDDAVIQTPNRQQKITFFSKIRVSAARASIQRRKPIVQRPHLSNRDEHRRNPALRTTPAKRSADICPSARFFRKWLHLHRTTGSPPTACDPFAVREPVARAGCP